MKINDLTMAGLALALSVERKLQGLSREDAAAVCGLSVSFIRDAESNPENCTLGKLAKLINGLGLKIEVSGLEASQLGLTHLQERFGSTASTKSGLLGLLASSTGHHHADFAVPDSQLVGSAQGGLPDLLSRVRHPRSGLGLSSLEAERDIQNKTMGESK